MFIQSSATSKSVQIPLYSFYIARLFRTATRAVLKPAVNLSETFVMFRFGGAVGFHVPLQICFVAEAARAERAFAEVVHVVFWVGFFFHGVSSFAILPLDALCRYCSLP